MELTCPAISGVGMDRVLALRGSKDWNCVKFRFFGMKLECSPQHSSTLTTTQPPYASPPTMHPYEWPSCETPNTTYHSVWVHSHHPNLTLPRACKCKLTSCLPETGQPSLCLTQERLPWLVALWSPIIPSSAPVNIMHEQR